MISTANAAAAGQLAAQIAAANAQVTQINGLISDGAIFQPGTSTVFDPANGMTTVMNTQQLTPAESAILFNAMLTIINARLSAWNTSLTAIP